MNHPNTVLMHWPGASEAHSPLCSRAYSTLHCWHSGVSIRDNLTWVTSRILTQEGHIVIPKGGCHAIQGQEKTRLVGHPHTSAPELPKEGDINPFMLPNSLAQQRARLGRSAAGSKAFET